MRENTSELIVSYLKGKGFVPFKELKENISKDAGISEEAIRVAIIRLEKSGHIEKKYEGKEKLFKYVSDFLTHAPRKADSGKYVKDFILELLSKKELDQNEIFKEVSKKFETTLGNVKTILSRESAKGTIKKIERMPLNKYTI